MPDQPTYPDFQVTNEGLRMLHQELGRRMHECYERAIHDAKKTAAHQQQIEQLAALADTPDPGQGG